MKISELLEGIKDKKILQMALRYGREEFQKGYIEGRKGTWLLPEEPPTDSQMVLVQVVEKSAKRAYPPQPEVAYYSTKRKDWDCNALGWLKEYRGLYKVVGWQPITAFGEYYEQREILQKSREKVGI